MSASNTHSARFMEASSIVVHGRVEGDLFGTKSVDLKGSAVLLGDIHASRVAIEEGALLMKGVQAQKAVPTPQIKKAG